LRSSAPPLGRQPAADRSPDLEIALAETRKRLADSEITE
jgi:hypothetical protein